MCTCVPLRDLPGSSVHGVARQECWSGLPLPPPGDLPDPGTEPTPPAPAGRFFTMEPPGKSLRPPLHPLPRLSRGGPQPQAPAQVMHQLCTESGEGNTPHLGEAPSPAWAVSPPCMPTQSVQSSRSVMSDSLRPYEPQHTRPPCPSPTPGVYSNSCPSSR